MWLFTHLWRLDEQDSRLKIFSVVTFYFQFENVDPCFATSNFVWSGRFLPFWNWQTKLQIFCFLLIRVKNVNPCQKRRFVFDSFIDSCQKRRSVFFVLLLNLQHISNNYFAHKNLRLREFLILEPPVDVSLVYEQQSILILFDWPEHWQGLSSRCLKTICRSDMFWNFID